MIPRTDVGWPGYPCTSPQIGVVAGRHRTGQQHLDHLLMVCGRQLATTTGVRFGLETGLPVLLLQLLPAMDGGGRSRHQASYFIDALAFIQ